MKSSLSFGKVLWAAALVSLPAVASAQDNAANNVAAESTMTNDTSATADPSLNDPMANDLGMANGMDSTAMPTDDTLVNDMALAETVAPEREDNDFPWGLLGLLGLAGLMGRNKKDVYVDNNRTDRRDI